MAVECRVGRVKLLDGLRGACLILMTITHLHFGRDYLLGYLHVEQLGFADSAQGFIFLSGLLVGLVGMRQYGREGMAPVRKRYWWRAAELYPAGRARVDRRSAAHARRGRLLRAAARRPA